MNRGRAYLACAALIVGAAGGAPAHNDTPAAPALEVYDYSTAYWECAEHGWAPDVVNACRWAAYDYFNAPATSGDSTEPVGNN